MASTDDTRLNDYNPVIESARGERKDYALTQRPIARGGQAEVFEARHKSSGIYVAFKRLRSRQRDAIARMKREIEASMRFGNNPHIMPIIDHGSNFDWFVMPLASETAEGYSNTPATNDQIIDLVTCLAQALKDPHEEGWVHRDIKPANILLLQGKWVLADWGIGRRPHGQTTTPGRTRVGVSFGTDGYAAPELSIDAHSADARADVYSTGQLIGWLVTQQVPQPNVPLIPPTGPWRFIVRSATRLEPDGRPQNLGALIELINQEFQPPITIPAIAGEKLLERANDGDDHAADQLFTLAIRHADNYELYIDVLARLNYEASAAAASADHRRAQDIVKSIFDHLGNSQFTPFGQVDALMAWALNIARYAAEHEVWDLLEEAADCLLEWDEHWDQWTPQGQISRWLRSLRGEAASILGRILRRHPFSVRHFADLADDRFVDMQIRSALAHPTSDRDT